MGGVISNVTVTLVNLNHTNPDDLDALLVGPAGQKIWLLSDAGGTGDLVNIALTFSDAAATTLSNNGQLSSGTFRPSNYDTSSDALPTPAPSAPYVTNLAVLNGQTANGTWALYVRDDASSNLGNVSGGWRLNITTAAAQPQPPTISDIGDQATTVDTPTAAIPFTINDADTPIGNLTMSRNSSNPTLMPTNNIVFGGSGNNRTVTLTPVAGQTGSATITVTVSDGSLTASDTFVLTVGTVSTGTASFTNSAAIAIADVGAGNPYPSVINVTGLGGTVNNVMVRLNGISHTWPDDIDILLVSPTGQKVMVFSDVGGSADLNNVTITLSDAAAAALSDAGQLVSGTFRPTDAAPGEARDLFPGPAPVGPYVATLSTFNGFAANGAWSLYVNDDGAGDQGSIAAGWNLTITTASTGAQPPTISDIGDQATTVNTATAAIPFTINDADTPVGNLTLSRSSSNPTLVPTNNIVFGGSGNNRTVTLTPASGQTGSATITVSVSDGALSASDTFVLTVTAVNSPPTLTGIGDQTINEDTSTGALGFTVGDGESAAGSLTLGRSSSNAALVPTNNIVFGGSGASRTVTVSPAANQSGSATITVSVSDGQYTTSTNFVVTVSAVNDAPTITSIGNQTLSVNGTTGPLNFTVGDVESGAGSLTVSPGSSNPTLVPVGNIVFGGSGASRTVTVTPASGQSGSATITVSVSDGVLSASNSFVVTVSAVVSGTQSFTNTGAITIPGVGNASPYPAVINVSGLGGTVSNVTVTLRGFTHTWPGDVDVLLVGPGGQKVLVMSDALGGNALNNVTLTLADTAAGSLPESFPVSAGSYKPTNYDTTTDAFGAPAPGAPYVTNLAVFNGSAANGAWSLYVMDDGAGDQGSIAGGWSLTITTTGGAARLAVVEEAPRITAVTLNNQGAVRVTVSGPIGHSYALEASSDFINWNKVDVQDNLTGTLIFTDQPTNTTRFYRAVARPNP